MCSARGVVISRVQSLKSEILGLDYISYQLTYKLGIGNFRFWSHESYPFRVKDSVWRKFYRVVKIWFVMETAIILTSLGVSLFGQW
jgi:hypothetical protein